MVEQANNPSHQSQQIAAPLLQEPQRVHAPLARSMAGQSSSTMATSQPVQSIQNQLQGSSMRQSQIGSTIAGSKPLQAPYSRAKFIEWLRNYDTIVDTLFILGPNNWEGIAELANGLNKDNCAEIAEEIKNMVEPEIMSMYPDFNREKIDTDESQQYFALSSAFPNGYQPVVSKDRPLAVHQAAYSHGGSSGTIYAMLYTFYEDVKDYQLAAFEHKRINAQRELEQTFKRIQEMNQERDRLLSSQDQEDVQLHGSDQIRVTGKSEIVEGFGSNATTAACSQSISSRFQRLKQDNVTNLNRVGKRIKQGNTLDFQLPKLKRAATPKAQFANRRLPMPDYFESSQESSKSSSSSSREEVMIESLADEAGTLFKSAGLEKLSPRPVQHQQQTSPYARKAKDVNNYLSILVEEREEDDVDDSHDRTKSFNNVSGGSGENPQMAAGVSASQKNSEVQSNQQAQNQPYIHVEEIKQEEVRQSEFDQEALRLRAAQTSARKIKEQKQHRTVSVQQELAAVPGSSTRETLTKSFKQVASRHSPTNGNSQVEKAKKKLQRESDQQHRQSEKEPQIQTLFEEKREVLTSSLNETQDRIREIDELKAALEQTRKQDSETIWLPKVFCVFSPYLFYDKYVEIIERLVNQIQQGDQGLPNLFEALVFEIVCKIETPVRKPVLYRDIRVQSSTNSFNLPYISDSFFNRLLNKVPTATIIQIFTHLLCEEKIILIADNPQELIPIWLALHSLIYPFKYANGTPYTRDDKAEDDDENEMAGVCPPMPFFNGIVKDDFPTAKRIIEYEDYTSPLFIDVTQKDQQHVFSFVNRKNQQVISNQGIARPIGQQTGGGTMTWADFEQRRLDKKLPQSVRDKLLNKIEKKKRQDEQNQNQINNRSSSCYVTKHSYSSEAIEAIRGQFFKAIIELFSGYDEWIEQDEDGNTVFRIEEFAADRPTEYIKFYNSFFQDQTQTLEHFGFMEFLNLQHSGERDSELAQKKENFDNYVVKITVKNNHFQDQERNRRGKVEPLPAIPARDIKPSPITNKSNTEIRDSYFKRSEWATLSGDKGEEEQKGSPMANDAESDQDKKSHMSGQLPKSRREKPSAEEENKAVVPLYPIKAVQHQIKQNPWPAAVAQNKTEVLRMTNDFEVMNSMANPSMDPPFNLQDQALRETMTSSGLPQVRVRYRIVPPLNPSLMDEFERAGYAEAQEENKDRNRAVTDQKKAAMELAANYGEPPFIQERKRDERTFVYLCWIYMWCGTLWEQDKKEQLFRTNQLLQVISKLKAKSQCLPDTKIFYLIIDTCYRYGMFRMTKRVYDSMRSCQILPSNAIFRCFFQHQKKEQRAQRPKDPYTRVPNNKQAERRQRKDRTDDADYARNREYLLQRKEEQLLDTTSKLCRQINYSLNFRKRTFKMLGSAPMQQQQYQINCEQVRLKLEEECKECNGQLLASQLRKAIAKASQEMGDIEEESIQGAAGVGSLVGSKDGSGKKRSQGSGKGQSNAASNSGKTGTKVQIDTKGSYQGDFKKIPKNQIKVLCTFCGQLIPTPTLWITIGKQVHRQIGLRSGANGGSSGHADEQTQFQSASSLFEDICRMLKQHNFKVQLNNLRLGHEGKQRFWNLIYYFNEYHLPYEFILPYECKQFERELKRYEQRSKKTVKVQK